MKIRIYNRTHESHESYIANEATKLELDRGEVYGEQIMDVSNSAWNELQQLMAQQEQLQEKLKRLYEKSLGNN